MRWIEGKHPAMVDLKEDSAEEITPFIVLNLSPSFSLPQLDNHVLELQKQEHPDLFVRQPERRIQAESRFSQIVWAYEELKDCKKRAQWLFKEAGFWPLPQKRELLEDMMDIEEAFSGGDLTKDQLQKMCEDAALDLAGAFAEAKQEEAVQYYMRWSALCRLLEREGNAC